MARTKLVLDAIVRFIHWYASIWTWGPWRRCGHGGHKHLDKSDQKSTDKNPPSAGHQH